MHYHELFEVGKVFAKSSWCFLFEENDFSPILENKRKFTLSRFMKIYECEYNKEFKIEKIEKIKSYKSYSLERVKGLIWDPIEFKTWEKNNNTNFLNSIEENVSDKSGLFNASDISVISEKPELDTSSTSSENPYDDFYDNPQNQHIREKGPKIKKQTQIISNFNDNINDNNDGFDLFKSTWQQSQYAPKKSGVVDPNSVEKRMKALQELFDKKYKK